MTSAATTIDWGSRVLDGDFDNSVFEHLRSRKPVSTALAVIRAQGSRHWSKTHLDNLVSSVNDWCADDVVKMDRTGDLDHFRTGEAIKNEARFHKLMLGLQQNTMVRDIIGDHGDNCISLHQSKALVRQMVLVPVLHCNEGETTMPHEKNLRFLMSVAAEQNNNDFFFFDTTPKKPLVVETFPEVNFYSKKAASLRPGQLPFFIPPDGADFSNIEGSAGKGYLLFGKAGPGLASPRLVQVRRTPFLTRPDAGKVCTPVLVSRQFGEKGKGNPNSLDDRLSRVITARMAAVPFTAQLRRGHDDKSGAVIDRMLESLYEGNPMFTRSKNIAPGRGLKMFDYDHLPGMFVRAHMVVKATDIESNQGTLMTLVPTKDDDVATGVFYSGFDNVNNIHVMSFCVLTGIGNKGFDPSKAFEKARPGTRVGHVQIFSHQEHKRILEFFCGHVKSTTYQALVENPPWGDDSNYSLWCGKLERLFIVLVGAYGSLYENHIGEAGDVHSLGVVYTKSPGPSGFYQVLDAAAMLEAATTEGVVFSQQFKKLSRDVFGDHANEILVTPILPRKKKKKKKKESARE